MNRKLAGKKDKFWIQFSSFSVQDKTKPLVYILAENFLSLIKVIGKCIGIKP